MTLDAFLMKLAATPALWTIGGYGCIRSECGCPIVAVAGSGSRWLSDWQAAYPRLGLSLNDAVDIQKAADMSYGYDERLRARLLAATVERM